MQKRIKIPHNGPIYAKGGVYGPIKSAFVEHVSNIRLMLIGGVNVVEVLKDGSEIGLTLENYDKDNNPEVRDPEIVKPLNSERQAVKEDVVKEENKKIENNNNKKFSKEKQQHQQQQPKADVIEQE